MTQLSSAFCAIASCAADVFTAVSAFETSSFETPPVFAAFFVRWSVSSALSHSASAFFTSAS